MSKRPSLSLASLSVNAPAAANQSAPPATTMGNTTEKDIKASSDKDNKTSNRLQVAFRMNKDAYKELRRMALDEDTTVNALLLKAVNVLRVQKGLAVLKD